jgi:hypothetical protein
VLGAGERGPREQEDEHRQRAELPHGFHAASTREPSCTCGDCDHNTRSSRDASQTLRLRQHDCAEAA